MSKIDLMSFFAVGSPIRMKFGRLVCSDMRSGWYGRNRNRK